ncbi:PAS domain S-box protein [bacterium]|nr:PAS domain S-box protein [bacterium]
MMNDQADEYCKPNSSSDQSYDNLIARYQAISAGIMVKDPSGRITYVNNAACEIFGLTCEEMIGRRSDDIIWRTVKADGSPLPSDEFPSALVLQTGIPQHNVIFGIYSSKHGPRRWLMEDAVPIRDPKTGNIKEVMLTITDVTGQVHNREALQEAETKYRTLIEESLVGVYLIQDSKFVYANPRFAEIHGFTQHELIGMNAQDLVAPEDRDVVSDYITRRISGEIKSVRYMVKGMRKDGTLIDIEVHGSYTLYQGKPAIIGTELDITQRRRDEETLRLNEARLQTLLELSQMTDATLQEICDFALQEAINLTKSKIGYLAFANEDETVLNMFAWSQSAREQCNIPDKPTVYPVEHTGLWGEAIRQRKAIITNDYSAPNPYKKGLPEGHITVKSHMNVPVFDGEKIVAVAGVGNKDEAYDESDIRQLTLLMDGMWKLLQRHQVERQRREEEYNRRQLERGFETQKRHFYRETILSVTQGKLDICDSTHIRPYLLNAITTTDVSDTSDASRARHMVKEFLARQDMEEERLAAFVIAVGEAITNAIKHGNNGRVYAGVKDDSAWVAVADKGPGIESLIIPRATLLRGFSTKPSLGLGYSIMLETSDHILLKTSPRGTTVVLVKNIKEPAAAADNLPSSWYSLPAI